MDARTQALSGAVQNILVRWCEQNNIAYLDHSIIIQILQAGQKAGLKFVDENAEFPTNPDVPEKYNELACGPEDDTDNIARGYYLQAQQDMKDAGWEKTKPIEVEE